MRESFNKVMHKTRTQQMDMRTAAFVIAIERLEETYVQRGIFP